MKSINELQKKKQIIRALDLTGVIQIIETAFDVIIILYKALSRTAFVTATKAFSPMKQISR